MTKLPTATITFIFLLASANVGHAALPNDVNLVNVHPNNTFPQILEYLQAPGDNSRYFAVLQSGEIRVVSNGQILPTPFLQLGGRTISSGEQGLLGMAFHPDYESNGLFYLNYTAGSTRPPGTNFGDTILAEFVVSENPDVAESTEQRIIMTIHQDFGNHNGGHIAFGPDGYLYVGMGDGGSSGDPCNRSQTLNPSDLATSPLACNNPSPLPSSAALLGKMLRIDVDNTTAVGTNNLCAANSNGSANYAVPEDNPFSDNSSVCGEIWSYGLRNPWRWSFDRETGDLWIADVGQSTREEVNLEIAASSGGLNYGWKCFEGTHVYQSNSYCNGIDHFEPIMQYNTSPTNCSITGGYRYRGPVESLQGLYLFADFCSRRLFVASDSGGWSFAQGPIVGTGSGWGAGVSSFGEDLDGHVFVMQRNGAVWRLDGDLPTYSIGGIVNGLSGTGLVLQNNGDDDLEISVNGEFQFETPIDDGEDYLVTVFSQPASPVQECSVSNGAGTIDGEDVADVEVNCVTATFTIGGEVIGLEGAGLILQNNGGDDLTISANGTFVFATPIEDLGSYNVVVSAQPESPQQTCTVANGQGQLAGEEVEDITITCVSDTFTIGGMVTGLEGMGLVLQNNGGDDLAISADGTFEFATVLTQGQTYSVTVASQPAGPLQECEVANGEGAVATSDIDDIQVTCIDLNDEIFDDRFEESAF